MAHAAPPPPPVLPAVAGRPARMGIPAPRGPHHRDGRQHRRAPAPVAGGQLGACASHRAGGGAVPGDRWWMGRDGSSNCDPGSRERGAGVVAGKKVAAGPEAVQCVAGEKTSPKTASSGLIALAISSYFYTKHLHTRTLRQRLFSPFTAQPVCGGTPPHTPAHSPPSQSPDPSPTPAPAAIPPAARTNPAPAPTHAAALGP